MRPMDGLVAMLFTLYPGMNFKVNIVTYNPESMKEFFSGILLILHHDHLFHRLNNQIDILDILESYYFYIYKIIHMILKF